MCGRLGPASMRVMLSITRTVELRGPLATVVASWLAAATVALTHDPDAAPVRKKIHRGLEAL